MLSSWNNVEDPSVSSKMQQKKKSLHLLLTSSVIFSTDSVTQVIRCSLAMSQVSNTMTVGIMLWAGHLMGHCAGMAQ